MSDLHLSCPECGATNRLPTARLRQKSRCGQCKIRLSPFSAPIEIDREQQLAALVEGPLPVLIDFYADWCGPCRMMAPELEALAKQLEGNAIIAKVNSASQTALSARHQVQVLPTLVMYRGREERWRHEGAMRARELQQVLAL